MAEWLVEWGGGMERAGGECQAKQSWPPGENNKVEPVFQGLRERVTSEDQSQAPQQVPVIPP
jgi:hypothetical protein